MEWIIVSVLIICVLIFLSKRNIKQPVDYPYELRQKLFSPAERSFFGVLCQAANGQAFVLGKVRIADVIKPAKGLGRSAWQRAFNRISAKHFDYVICKENDLSVMAVIELDDSSHDKKKQIDRDKFVEGVCTAASLTLQRFKASQSYNVLEIREKLFPQPITPEENDITEPGHQVSSESHQKRARILFCPKCKSKLIKKTAKKGKHKGAQFLACSAFPKCKYIEKITT